MVVIPLVRLRPDYWLHGRPKGETIDFTGLL
jgi:hypothetical protein